MKLTDYSDTSARGATASRRSFFLGLIAAVFTVAFWIYAIPIVEWVRDHYTVPLSFLVAFLVIELIVFMRNPDDPGKLFWTVSGTVLPILCVILIPIISPGNEENEFNPYLITFIIAVVSLFCMMHGLFNLKTYVHTVRYFFIFIAAVIFILPFYWMFVNSLKSFQEIFTAPSLFPTSWKWSNYSKVFNDPQLPFRTYFLNTFIIASIATAGQLVSCSIVAYAFARLRFKGRDFLFLVVLATMMIPFQVTMIPLYVGFIHLNEMRFLGLPWLNSILPIVVPQLFATAFNVFLLRQFFRTIPYELDEAANIDGCSKFGVFFRIILPLSRPALVICGLFTFFWNWKDLMGPLIYFNSRESTTISVGLTFLKNPKHIDWQLIMAASAISLIPVVILFFIGQRYIIRGITMTGIKA